MHYAYNNILCFVTNNEVTFSKNLFCFYSYVSVIFNFFIILFVSFSTFLSFFLFSLSSLFNFLCVFFRCTKLKFVQKIQEKFASIDNYSTRISTHSKKFITYRNILYFLYN